jgi:hypothetical protein
MAILRAFLVLFLMCSMAMAAPVAYHTYSNDKYGYSVRYPAFLRPEGEPDAHDGQRFSSRSSPLRMTVWGTYSNWQTGDDMTIAQQRAWHFRNLDKKWKVTYKANGGNWFVLSGYNGDDIFYSRTVKHGDIFATVLLEYPKSKKSEFDAAVEIIARSLQ